MSSPEPLHDPITFRIERVAPGVTRPIRQRLLMQHRTIDQLAASDGDYPDAGYFVARTADSEVVATASTRREPPSWDPAATDAWRIRGMVTAEELRGRGVGSRLLGAAMDHAIRHGARLLWCHVRAPAIPFYQRAGLTPIGAPWDDPDTGPHIAMHRPIQASLPAKGASPTR